MVEYYLCVLVPHLVVAPLGAALLLCRSSCHTFHLSCGGRSISDDGRNRHSRGASMDSRSRFTTVGFLQCFVFRRGAVSTSFISILQEWFAVIIALRFLNFPWFDQTTIPTCSQT